MALQVSAVVANDLSVRPSWYCVAGCRLFRQARTWRAASLLGCLGIHPVSRFPQHLPLILSCLEHLLVLILSHSPLMFLQQRGPRWIRIAGCRPFHHAWWKVSLVGRQGARLVGRPPQQVLCPSIRSCTYQFFFVLVVQHSHKLTLAGLVQPHTSPRGFSDRCFLARWSGLFLYAFPPFTLILRTLTKDSYGQGRDCHSDSSELAREAMVHPPTRDGSRDTSELQPDVDSPVLEASQS